MMNSKRKLSFYKPDFLKLAFKSPTRYAKTVPRYLSYRTNAAAQRTTEARYQLTSLPSRAPAGPSAMALTAGQIGRSSSLEIPLLATQKQGEHTPGLIPAVVVWRLWKMTRRSNIRWRIMTEPWATGLSSVMLQSMASCLAMHVLGSFKPTQMNLFPMLYKRIAPLT